MPVLITGATGANGRDIVRELAALGVPTRALVRDASKAADLRALGAELAIGTFEEPAGIEAAARGCDRALLLVPVDQRMTEFAASAIAALSRAGVGHIVYFSAIGANPGGKSFFTRAHGQAERALRESGRAWTALRPNFFMQNALASAATIKAESRFYNHIAGKSSHVDVRDIAAVAARVLSDPVEQHRGKALNITGPESLGSAERAAIMSRVLGRTVTSVDIPRDAMRQGMIAAGLPEWVASAITDLDEVVINGAATPVSDVVRTVGRRPGISFEQFVRDNAAAFAA